MSSFSPIVQTELATRNIGKDGFVYAADMDRPVRCLLDNAKKSISVKAFNPDLQARLAALDPQNKGHVTFDLLEEACLVLIKKKSNQRYMTIFWTLVVISSVLIIAALFGLLWLVVDLRKDTQNVHGVLVDRTTGRPLETASTDFTVVKGVLVSRNKTAGKASNRRADDISDSSTTLATSPFWSPVQVSSEMDSLAFTAIPSLSLAPPGSAGLVFAQVGGFASIPSARAPGSKVVVFFTDFGRVVLNGTKLFPAVGPYSDYAAMDAAGVLTAAFSPQQKGGRNHNSCMPFLLCMLCIYIPYCTLQV